LEEFARLLKDQPGIKLTVINLGPTVEQIIRKELKVEIPKSWFISKHTENAPSPRRLPPFKGEG
jgi:hypothetical protein